jgi:hypothetical protein
MLFLVNNERIPSVAKIVQLGTSWQLAPTEFPPASSDRLLIQSQTPAPPPPKAQTGQIEVAVGLTPTCPYGLCACWGAAYESLSKLSGRVIVGDVPDNKACTAIVLINECDILKTYDWQKEFEGLANGSYRYRGVEVSAEGGVTEENGNLFLQLSSGPKLLLKSLISEHVVQWDLFKQAPAVPSGAESRSYDGLKSQIKKSSTRIIGPLSGTKSTPILEVRVWQV